MSEYQFFEFRALDRTLAKDDLAKLRAISSRAELTPASFVNVYNYGSFKGDEIEFLTRWYDAHLYLANWGTRRLMLAFPRTVLAPEAIKSYFVAEGTSLHVKGDRVILDLQFHLEEWEWADGAGLLDGILPVRADIAAGDYRALYLAWLTGVQFDFGFGFEEGESRAAEEDDEQYDFDIDGGEADEAQSVDDEPDGTAIEPPVPPGLNQLTEPLKAMADFLRLDRDLLAVAAERSPNFPPAKPAAETLVPWIESLPSATKDAFLIRLAAGDEPHLRADLIRRFQEATRSAQPPAPFARRTVGELLSAAEQHAATRRKAEAERAAKEAARQARAEAAARAAYLDGLTGHEEALWRDAERFVLAKPARYDQAVQLLVDLHDHAVRIGTEAAFAGRMADFRIRYQSRPTLRTRLAQAGLDG